MALLSLRTAGVAAFAIALTLSIACPSANAQTSSINGWTLSSSEVFNATSGTAEIVGNATLSGSVTFNLAFQIDYLVVGGGGSGSVTLGPANFVADAGGGGGGGGGGGVMMGSAFLTGSAGVTIGAGGAGVSSPGAGNNGENSSLTLGATTITGTGGSGGTVSGDGGASGNGVSGGSGPGGGGGGAGQAGGGGPGGYGGVGVPWTYDVLIGTRYGAGGGGADGGVAVGGGPGVLAGGSGGDTGGGNGGDPFVDPSGGAGQNGLGAGGGGGIDGGSSGSGGYGTVQFVYLGSQIGVVTNGSQATSGYDSAYTAVSFSGPGNGSFLIMPADLETRLAATLTGNLTGSGGFTFVGPGTLTLTGSSNFTGASAVQSAKLFVNGQVTSSTMSVDNESFLGGTGSILAVNLLSGGTLAPGATDGSVGQMTIGTLTLGAGGTTVMQINDQFGDSDKISGTSLTNGGTLEIQLSGDTYGVDTQFDIYDFTSVTGTFAGISMAGSSDGWQNLSWYAPGQSGVGLYDYGQEVWQTDWTTVGGESRKLIFNQVDGKLTVVPEPSTIAMAGAGLAAAAIMRWRRHRRSGAAREEAVAGRSTRA